MGLAACTAGTDNYPAISAGAPPGMPVVCSYTHLSFMACVSSSNEIFSIFHSSGRACNARGAPRYGTDVAHMHRDGRRTLCIRCPQRKRMKVPTSLGLAVVRHRRSTSSRSREHTSLSSAAIARRVDLRLRPSSPPPYRRPPLLSGSAACFSQAVSNSTHNEGGAPPVPHKRHGNTFTRECPGVARQIRTHLYTHTSTHIYALTHRRPINTVCI